MKRISVLLILAVAFGMVFAGAAHAEEFIGGHIITSYAKVVGPYPSPFFDAMKKMGRGITNIVTGPIELFKQPLVEADKADSVGEFVTGFTYGIFAGVAWMFYRDLDGIYELTTFYLPSLGPVINPEYIF